MDPYNACTENSVPLARIYMIAALVIGFFVVFNLFIAILLDSFADDDDSVEEDEEDKGGGEIENGGVLSMLVSEEDVPEHVGPTKSGAPLLRKVCLTLANHPMWEQAIIAAILVSSVALALDEPRLESPLLKVTILPTLNYFFTALFTFELVVKVLAYDLLAYPDGYLLSAWNLLDLFIVSVSLISLCPEMNQLSALRLLRVLRPLRLLSRIPGMKVIFAFFAEAADDIINVTGVVLFFQTVFAIFGMELFMDTFGSCTDPTILTRAECFPQPPDAPTYLRVQTVDDDYHRRLSQGPPLLPPLPASLDGITRTSDHRQPPPPVLFGESAAPLVHDDLGKEPGKPKQALVSAVLTSETAAAARRRLRTSKLQKQLPSATSQTNPPKPWNTRGRHLKGGGSGGGGGNLDLPVAWLNPPFGSFDDFGSAMAILFIASTGDGWEDFMFQGMDVTEPGQAPARNDFSPNALFFIAWLLVGTFTTLNLFVGSVVDNFTRIKGELEGSALMTKEQKQWVRTLQDAKQNKKPVKVPKPPEHPWLKPFFSLVVTKEFDIFITVVVISNILVMALDFHRIEEHPGYHSFYTKALLFFSYVYYCECLFKLLGYGVKTYFSDNWNRFDFFLVVTSLFDQFAAELLEAILPIPPMLLRILRVARIMRIMRLLKGFKGIRDLLMTMVLSFPSFMNIGVLLALVTFIYAVLGVQLFTFVMEGESLNSQRNFLSFGSAYLLLVQCLTGDNWSSLMYDAMVGPERGCDPDAVPTDCGNAFAIPYFISYMIVGAFVLLNLVVAVILENFTALGDVNPDLVSAVDIAKFGELWGQFDDDATGLILDEVLPELLLVTPPPLGLMGKMDRQGAQQFVQELELDLEGTGWRRWIQFTKCTEALIKQSYMRTEGFVPPELPPGEDQNEEEAPAPPATAKLERQASRFYRTPPDSEQTPVTKTKSRAPPALASPTALTGSQKNGHRHAGGHGRCGEQSGDGKNQAMSRSGMGPSSLKTTVDGANGHASSNSEPHSARHATFEAERNAHYVATPTMTAGQPVARWSTPQVQLIDDTMLPSPAVLPPPFEHRHKGIQQGAAPPYPPPGIPPPLPDGWRCVHRPQDSSGHASTYFYNIETRQVSWTPPSDWIRSSRRRRRTSEEGDDSKPAGWDA